MFVELPQNLILMTVGAFLLGWILSAISSRMGSGQRAKKRDPRDDRIRQLDAELRITQTELASAKEKIENFEEEVETVNEGIEKRDSVISQQQGRIEELKRDLKESVIKTRELRHELSDRAAENVKSEVKLRDRDRSARLLSGAGKGIRRTRGRRRSRHSRCQRSCNLIGVAANSRVLA
jgi:predicted  nucleic acid-binding Zn-ribbon protein